LLSQVKKIVPYVDGFGQALRWMAAHGTLDSVGVRNEEEFLCFAEYSEGF
jgi:hypothetical protein